MHTPHTTIDHQQFTALLKGLGFGGHHFHRLCLELDPTQPVDMMDPTQFRYIPARHDFTVFVFMKGDELVALCMRGKDPQYELTRRWAGVPRWWRRCTELADTLYVAPTTTQLCSCAKMDAAAKFAPRSAEYLALMTRVSSVSRAALDEVVGPTTVEACAAAALVGSSPNAAGVGLRLAEVVDSTIVVRGAAKRFAPGKPNKLYGQAVLKLIDRLDRLDQLVRLHTGG